jgi:capsular polysaccharide biosynthesis protein
VNVNLEAAVRAVVGALLIAVGAALIVTLLTLASTLRTPIYEPSAQVSVDLQRQSDQQMNQPATGERLQTTTKAMVPAAGNRPVAKEAIRRLGLKMSAAELLDNLTVEEAESKKVIVLTYADTDRVKATQIVNTLAKVASERISKKAVAGSNLTATVYKEARVPKPPPDPKPLRNGLLTLVVVWALYAGLTLVLLAVLRR